ncbi:MAG: hypothetical protein HUJ22_10105 [Gracilimonas sp.]|uniref:hypothetical protein n=1 Tax=Gracilimonas sp. TaxID=1974203 RepID=UPI0019A381A6|nr:hypothetical protein [Gracilimonas sp.]MBD3616913.1 hypothetical protein [Gracilimonas sp.]
MKTLIYTNLLLVVFFLTFSVPALAQEKQSDATWEETVDFIKSKKSYIEVKFRFYADTWRGTKSELIATSKIESLYSTSMNFKYYKKADKAVGEKANASVSARLSFYDLKNVFDPNYGFPYSDFALRTTGENICVSTQADNYDYSYRNCERVIGIDVEDTEMRPRILKAFKHLAYLATEYREEQRKASGDAF